MGFNAYSAASLSVLLLWPLVCQAGNIGDVPTPRGYRRTEYADSSYSAWIRRLPLREDGRIMGSNGKPIARPFYDILAVVDLPLLFSEDIEQCADWCFRFWSMYHQDRNALNSLYLLDYNGRRMYYRDSRRSLKSFLRWAMASANSYSIKRGGLAVGAAELRPGDMLVQNRGGGIGHVSVIVDVCRSRDGECLYLIGYSFMPAQQFHLERAGGDDGRDGWFSLPGYLNYLKQNLDYGTPSYRRF